MDSIGTSGGETSARVGTRLMLKFKLAVSESKIEIKFDHFPKVRCEHEKKSTLEESTFTIYVLFWTRKGHFKRLKSKEDLLKDLFRHERGG